MSNIRSSYLNKYDSDNIRGYEDISYSNIRADTGISSQVQSKFDYFDKHISLLDQRISLLENAGKGDRIKYLEDALSKQRAEFTSKLIYLEDQIVKGSRQQQRQDDPLSASKVTTLEVKVDQIERTLKQINSTLEQQNRSQAGKINESDILFEIRKLSESLTQCMENQRRIEAQISSKNREVSFDHASASYDQRTTPPKSENIQNYLPHSGSNKKDSDKKDGGPYGSLKNKYGNIRTQDTENIPAPKSASKSPSNA